MQAPRFAIVSGVLRTKRQGLLIWALSLAGVCGMYTGLYPSMEKVDLAAMVKALPQGMVEALGYDDMATAAGYVGSAIYGLVGFVLLLVFGITVGGGLLAGEEDSGALELELTSPRSRQAIYAQRLLALWALVAALVGVVFAVTLGLSASMSMGIPVRDLVVATLALLLLVGLFASLAFAAGAATGRPGVARGVGAAVAVAGFMANALAKTVGQPWLARVSPVGWYMEENPVTGGHAAGDLALLAVSCAVVITLGLWRFTRRDVTV